MEQRYRSTNPSLSEGLGKLEVAANPMDHETRYWQQSYRWEEKTWELKAVWLETIAARSNKLLQSLQTVMKHQETAEAMQKVGKEGRITAERSKGIVDVVEGMQFDLWLYKPLICY